MKGQTLVVGAVIFAGILLLASFPSGPSITGTQSNTQLFSENSLDTMVEAFNQGITDNKTYRNAKVSIYRYNRFLERTSTSKGITYESYQFFILPEEEKASFINYQSSKANVTVELGDETFSKDIIDSKQNKEYSYSREGNKTQVNLTLNNRDKEYDFEAASPRIAAWNSLDSEDEKWANSIVG